MQSISSFTNRSIRIERVLLSKVGIADPIQTRLAGVAASPQTYIAIWDTGASGTVITQKIVKDLNLQPTGMANVNTANGSCTVSTYSIDLWMPNNICIQGIKVTEGTITANEDVLIGMDVLSLGDFAVSNFGGKTTFSFRVPSIAETDYVALSNTSQPIRSDKVGRNDPCPCGSGKHYKKCCGKNQ